MELINLRNNKKTYVKEQDIVDGLYHFKYKLDLTQSEDKIKQDKIFISKLKYQIALYDIKSDNLYLVNREQVYDKVFNQNYRFITKKYLNEFIEKKQKTNEEKYKDHPFKSNHMNKYNYFINFLQNFDLDVYFRTYIDVLYNIDELGGELTFKEKPSYAPMKILSHIKPYYSRTEIVFYGLNNKLINSQIVSNEEIQTIYDELKKYEFRFELLLDHYNYILKSEVYELIQYYSLQSYKLINDYLRFTKEKNNNLINRLINKINETIINVKKESTNFENDFYVYRFVDNDFYISNLDIGDTFTEKGFLSATRNPFYKTKNDTSFGWTLLKIKVPKDYYFLCIETVSMLPNEEEVIFPTNTALKLVNKDNNCEYYHTDPKVQKKIKIKYEFEILNESYKVEKLPTDIKKVSDNYFKFRNIEGYIESTNTLENYSDFYIYKNNEGKVLFCFIDYKLLMIVEVYNSIAYINFSFIYKGKLTYLFNYFNDFKDFSDFINYLNDELKLNIEKIELYGGYINCNKNQINYYYKGGTYCYEIYYYLKYGKENNFYLNSQYIVPTFDLAEFKKLYNYHITDIIQRIDNTGRYTEIYYLLNQTYLRDGGKDNIVDFYLFLVDNCCYFIDILKQMVKEYFEDRDIKIDFNIFKKLVYDIDFKSYNEKRKRVNEQRKTVN